MEHYSEKEYESWARKIFTKPSPTGWTDGLINEIKQEIEQWGYTVRKLHHGGLEVYVEGREKGKVLATSAHVDTLGLMVRSIRSDGTLALTKLGSPNAATLDGEYCHIVTRDGRSYTGTIVSTSASSHVYSDAESKSRDIDNLIVRLDELVHSEKEVRDLGIEHGDIIWIDPKYEWTKSGFLKSRFIDDKGSVLVLLLLLKYWKEHNEKPRYSIYFYFAVFEEVGHGASCIREDISEFVTCDMGCVGKDLAGKETAVSICAKDSGGPYDYELTTRLIQLAKEHELPYTVDIFPYYGSDVGSAYRAGKDIKGALVGPGVSASHGMERSHYQGLCATFALLYYYFDPKR